jgi:hypothetical protein
MSAFWKPLEADQHTFMANKMDSGVRSALKKYGESLKQKEPA